MKGWKLCSKMHPSKLNPNYAAASRGRGEWQHWGTPYCREWRSPSADLNCCLGRFAVQIRDAVDRLLRLFRPLDYVLNTLPHKHQPLLPGEAWRVGNVIMWLWGWGSRAWEPRWFSPQSPQQVRVKGLRKSEEEWTVSAGEQLAAQLVVITKICFLWPMHPPWW